MPHRDRLDKSHVYARAGITVYWVINLDDMTVEAFTQPSGLAAALGYARIETHRPGDDVPVVLDGHPSVSCRPRTCYELY